MLKELIIALADWLFSVVNLSDAALIVSCIELSFFTIASLIFVRFVLKSARFTAVRILLSSLFVSNKSVQIMFVSVPISFTTFKSSDLNVLKSKFSVEVLTTPSK